jgi:hypothetical protein
MALSSEGFAQHRVGRVGITDVSLPGSTGKKESPMRWALIRRCPLEHRIGTFSERGAFRQRNHSFVVATTWTTS